MTRIRGAVTLRRRLERLEVEAVQKQHHTKVRIGKLKRLSPEYAGERHTVISKTLSVENGKEWVEFEEVAGPDPNPMVPRRGAPDYINVVLVESLRARPRLYENSAAESSHREALRDVSSDQHTRVHTRRALPTLLAAG